MSYADDRYDSMTGSTDATELATPVETAELRGEALVWQMLHQACAQISNLAAHPHARRRRRALADVAARSTSSPRARRRRRALALGREAAARSGRRS